MRIKCASLCCAVPTPRDLTGVGALPRVGAPVGGAGALGGGRKVAARVFTREGALLGVGAHVVIQVTLAGGLVATLTAHMLTRAKGRDRLENKVRLAVHFFLQGYSAIFREPRDRGRSEKVLRCHSIHRVLTVSVLGYPVSCCFCCNS